METVFFLEQDPYCQAVLAKNWPGVPIYGDIREVSGSDLPAVDVLCGGFPCQDISVAGKGAGIEGERSSLWSEYARLIREIRPRYVVIENVAALLARGGVRVLADLAACGFDAEWDCLPASAFGAPHQRDRVWLVAYPSSDGVRDQSGRRSGQNGTGTPFLVDDGEARADTREDSHPHGNGRQGLAQRDRGAFRGSGSSLRDHLDGLRDAVADANSTGLPVGEGEREDARAQQPAAERGHYATGGTVWGFSTADPDWRPTHVADAYRLRRDGRSRDEWSRRRRELEDCGLQLVTDPDGILPGFSWRLGQQGNPEARRDVHQRELESPVRGVADELSPWLDRGGFAGWWTKEPPIPRTADGVPNRVARLKSLGNALVPVIAEWIGGRIVAYEET